MMHVHVFVKVYRDLRPLPVENKFLIPTCMKYTRRETHIRTLFFTTHAHILNLELWACVFLLSCFCCLLPNFVRNAELHRVQQDQPQNVGAVVSVWFTQRSACGTLMRHNGNSPPASCFGKSPDEKLIFNK